jgi:DNA repair exonuclease SbcCD ATPase subunit
MMQKLAASSIAAVKRALQRRLEKIQSGAARLAELDAKLKTLKELQERVEWEDADQISSLEEEIVDASTLSLMEDELPRLRDLLKLADRVGHPKMSPP